MASKVLEPNIQIPTHCPQLDHRSLVTRAGKSWRTPLPLVVEEDGSAYLGGMNIQILSLAQIQLQFPTGGGAFQATLGEDMDQALYIPAGCVQREGLAFQSADFEITTGGCKGKLAIAFCRVSADITTNRLYVEIFRTGKIEHIHITVDAVDVDIPPLKVLHKENIPAGCLDLQPVNLGLG